MSDVLHQANLLIRCPTLYTMESDSLQLVLRPKYAGIYFSMVTVTGCRLHCHATIGHWSSPIQAELLDDQRRGQILDVFKDAVNRAWTSTSSIPTFATVEAVDLSHRALATVHVQSGLSAAMWSLQRSVGAKLKASEGRRRTNFHFSVDQVVLADRA